MRRLTSWTERGRSDAPRPRRGRIAGDAGASSAGRSAFRRRAILSGDAYPLLPDLELGAQKFETNSNGYSDRGFHANAHGGVHPGRVSGFCVASPIRRA
jgi:hypothetical protein